MSEQDNIKLNHIIMDNLDCKTQPQSNHAYQVQPLLQFFWWSVKKEHYQIIFSTEKMVISIKQNNC